MFKEGIPRHTQISRWLRQQIQEGVYEVDEKLPSENELCQKFDVSRLTVRKALQTLENEQMIYRSQGLGSFVQDSRPQQSFVELTDFVEDMRRAGMEASSNVIDFEVTKPPKKVSSIMNLESSGNAVRLDRLRLGDGQPIALDVTWLPMFYGQLLEDHDLEEETIYGILEQDYDIPVEKGHYRIEAANADDSLAEHLGVEIDEALLLIDRLSLTIGDKPIYYQKRYYRSDRIVYGLTAERDNEHKPGTNNLPLRNISPIFNKQ